MFSKCTVSCFECNTEFEFNHSKKCKEFININNSKCPCCGSHLGNFPFPHVMLSTPPELKSYPVYFRRINMEDHNSLLDFSKWPKLNDRSKYPNIKEN